MEEKEQEDKDDLKQNDQGIMPNSQTERKTRRRKGIGTLWDNIKGAFRGNAKDIFILKAKLAIYGVIGGIIALSLLIEGDAEDTSSQSSTTVYNIYSSSTSVSAQTYKETGSLILATDQEVEQIKTSYFDTIKNSREGYYEALNTVFSGKESSTVANRVAHITSNYSSGEVQEVDRVIETAPSLAGAVKLSDSRTIYEHILLTEKYNFNNIIWRSYVKSGSGLAKSNIDFSLDETTKLVYPKIDSNSENGSEQNLEFFVSKIRPYLQSWRIPFDLTAGTMDTQDASNYNVQLAYNTIANAYHEIVMDRYKLERLARTTNYLIYDQTTTTTTTTRTCKTYTYSSGESAGEACTKEDYEAGLCKDSRMSITTKVPCNDKIGGNKICNVDDLGNSFIYKTTNCKDTWIAGCSYGTKKATTEVTYCTDDETTAIPTVVQGVRETKNPVNDVKTYNWTYVTSTAKMLDKVISNSYNFEAYYNYSTENYNNFINKTGDYGTKTIEEYREAEKTNSKSDELTQVDVDYNETEKTETASNASWKSSTDKYVVASFSSIPAGGTFKSGSTQTKKINTVVEITKTGKEYTDTYSWSDNLNFSESKSGIYNIDSVKDITGDDFSETDEIYYKALYEDKDINLIDLMNSDDTIYKDYIGGDASSSSTNNIGIRKSALSISYNVLRTDLQELAEQYPLSGLMYGNSLGILEGLNLGAVVAAGGINEALITLAMSHLGDNLDHMMSINNHGTFFRNHWCAMFVSYCLREIEHQTGQKIPIPNYAACTTFWNQNNAKPGFFDVKEWVEQGISGRLCVQSDPTHIAPLSSIQPGDIILFSYDSEGRRNHTSIVKTVEKDEAGNVTSITTIDGNWGTSNGGFNGSKVQEVVHTASSYVSLKKIASFVSISTVLAEAERGNLW